MALDDLDRDVAPDPASAASSPSPVQSLRRDCRAATAWVRAASTSTSTVCARRLADHGLQDRCSIESVRGRGYRIGSAERSADNAAP